MKEKLFWVAAVRYPTENDSKNGKGGMVLLQPVVVLAVDESAARLVAAKQLPDDISRVEVFVRPF